jgi:hypothetical protein
MGGFGRLFIGGNMSGYPENRKYHIHTDEIIDICKRQGCVFEASREVSIPAGGTVTSVFKTGNKPVILFARDIGYDGVGVNAFAYRDPSLSSNGTLETTTRNPNDINPQADTVEIYTSPTVVSIGTETRSPKYLFASTSNQAAGQSAKTIESPQFILPNKMIVLTITSRDTNSAQKVFAELRWAEVDRIPGIVLNSDGTLNRYNGRLL